MQKHKIMICRWNGVHLQEKKGQRTEMWRLRMHMECHFLIWKIRECSMQNYGEKGNVMKEIMQDYGMALFYAVVGGGICGIFLRTIGMLSI